MMDVKSCLGVVRTCIESGRTEHIGLTFERTARPKVPEAPELPGQSTIKNVTQKLGHLISVLDTSFVHYHQLKAWKAAVQRHNSILYYNNTPFKSRRW